MRLRRRRDAHARYLELLASRLDVPLRLDEAWQLDVHLSRCERCRAAEREYAEQRRALRALPPAHVPRDLWARTSAALDREMAGHGRELERPDGTGATPRAVPAARGSRAGTGASIAASLAVFGAAALVVMSQWPLLERPAPTRLLPTPFAVPGQALAFLGAGPQGLSIYRTSVDHVCPLAASDCVNEHRAPSALALSTPIDPSSLALSPTGRQLAITGRGENRSSVVAIVTMPEPDESPARTPGPPGLPTLPATSAAAEPSEPVDPRLTPELSPLPAGLAVLTILSDAIGVGAPPAWSTDGQMLAFSAMPSDLSHGPDLYIWRPGDAVAERLTEDHSTYFASWAASELVVSRVGIEAGRDASSEPVPTTLAIDPLTGAERAIEAPSLWLPQVNQPGTHAIAWHGRLTWRGNAAVAELGALYLVDWATLDPRQPVAEPATSPEPTNSESPGQGVDPSEPEPADEPSTEPTDEPSTEPTDEPSTEPSDEPSAVPSDRPTPASPPAGSAAPTSAPTFQATLPPLEPSPGPSTPPAGQEPETPAPATPHPSPELSPLLSPVQPLRDPAVRPVRDWEVRWSPDGALVAIWIADAPGSSWGQLTVLGLDAQAGTLGLDAPLLTPTLARRSFTLGADRLAWVAPVEHNPEGELRLTAWGPDGFGVLRLSSPEDGAIAPF